MKRIVGALLLALAAGATGCASYRSYTYSGPEAATCLSKCEDARWECRNRCGADAVCQKDCDEAAKNCRKHCPAFSVQEPEPIY